MNKIAVYVGPISGLIPYLKNQKTKEAFQDGSPKKLRGKNN